MIAAISEQAFDGYPGATGNPNNNPICGKKVKATCKSFDMLLPWQSQLIIRPFS